MKDAALVIAVWAVLAGSAWAHGGDLPIGPRQLSHHWSFDPLVWAPLLAAHWLYGRGVLRAWRRAGKGRIISRGRVACFALGEIFLVIALISPLDPLGETLLSAHMGQHILLTTFAPLLLVLGAPLTAFTWALPPSWRKSLNAPLVRTLSVVGAFLTRPAIAASLHGVAIWVWHAPAAFDAALRDESWHTFEHVSFFVTALMFWSAVFNARSSAGVGAFYVLTTFVQSGALGAILVLAPAQLYAYGDRAMLWDLSPLADQQLAGLLMWTPAGLFYLAAFAFLGARMLDVYHGRRSSRERNGIMRASTSS